MNPERKTGAGVEELRLELNTIRGKFQRQTSENRVEFNNSLLSYMELETKLKQKDSLMENALSRIEDLEHRFAKPNNEWMNKYFHEVQKLNDQLRMLQSRHEEQQQELQRLKSQPSSARDADSSSLNVEIQNLNQTIKGISHELSIQKHKTEFSTALLDDLQRVIEHRSITEFDLPFKSLYNELVDTPCLYAEQPAMECRDVSEWRAYAEKLKATNECLSNALYFEHSGRQWSEAKLSQVRLKASPTGSPQYSETSGELNELDDGDSKLFGKLGKVAKLTQSLKKQKAINQRLQEQLLRQQQVANDASKRKEECIELYQKVVNGTDERTVSLEQQLQSLKMLHCDLVESQQRDREEIALLEKKAERLALRNTKQSEHIAHLNAFIARSMNAWYSYAGGACDLAVAVQSEKMALVYDALSVGSGSSARDAKVKALQKEVEHLQAVKKQREATLAELVLKSESAVREFKAESELRKELEKSNTYLNECVTSLEAKLEDSTQQMLDMESQFAEDAGRQVCQQELAMQNKVLRRKDDRSKHQLQLLTYENSVLGGFVGNVCRMLSVPELRSVKAAKMDKTDFEKWKVHASSTMKNLEIEFQRRINLTS